MRVQMQLDKKRMRETQEVVSSYELSIQQKLQDLQ